MPEGRMLRKKISRDEVVAKLSDKAIILYTWCIPHLDVRGKILADAHILKGIIVPYLKGFTLPMIEKCVKELGDSGLVIVYGGSHKYMKFNGFSKNQKIDEDREALSEIPDPTQEELTSNSGVTPAKDKISKDKIREVKKKFLEFVYLTNQEETKLIAQFGVAGAKERIENLNSYLGSKGDKYKSHYHTILNWERMNKKPQTSKGGAEARELKGYSP